MIAGCSAQFIASPTDLVKVRLQVEGKRVLEGKPARCRLNFFASWCSDLFYRYKGMVDAFVSIVREDGVRGLWKGWVPNCQRAAIVCLGGKYS